MFDTGKGNVNIDDLVNSLLLERQAENNGIEPIAIYDAEKAAMDLLDPIDENAEDDELDVEFIPLIDFDDVDDDEADNKPRKVVAVAEKKMTPSETPPTELKVAEVVAPAAVIDQEAPKKRRKWFGRNKEEDADAVDRSWVDWDLKPIGHYRTNEVLQVSEEVQEIQHSQVLEQSQPVVTEKLEPSLKSTQVDEFPAVVAASETITMQVVLPSGIALPRGEEHTRIVPNIKAEQQEIVQPSVPPVAVPRDEQLPDQLSLEEMVRVEDIEPTDGTVVIEEDIDPEERLQLTREEKVREFTLSGDEEESNEPEDEAIDVTEGAEIEDYTGYQDTETVSEELKYRCRTSLVSLLFTGLIQVVLLFFTSLTIKLDQPPLMSQNAYLLTHLFGLCIMMVLNFSTITRGLSGLFSLRANNDSAPAVASTVGLVEVIVHLLNPNAPLPYWTPLVGLLLLLSAVGHYAHECCVRRNFAFVSYPGDKYAAAVIEDDNALQEIGRRAVSDGEATVAYFRRTGFLTEYLANAYDDDCGDDWSRWVTPAALGLSVLLSLMALVGESVSGFMGWMSVFTGMVCLSMPLTMLAVQLPLSRCSRRMLANGGFLTGWKAVRLFGNLDALAVDIADLYPDESMRLHGIKTFSGTHIDEAILTAASLAVRSGGPLAMIFRRIIENKEELLYDVDSLVYEQGMGLSGWVDGRRVFVGNGRLLQNHGVDVPSADFEARYAKNGRRLVYISIAGQLSGMFVVSYLPDPEIQAALQELCRSRVTLLVRSCDPNITTSDLCESFELDEYYVDVLPASAGRMYVQLTEQPVESLPAVMASNGHILGTARVLSACRGMKVKARIALIVQTLIALLALILCLIRPLPLFSAILLVLASVFFSWFIPLFRRV